MGIHCSANGPKIQRDRSPSRNRCQCIESWNSGKIERERNPTLECGPNHFFSNSAKFFFTERSQIGVRSDQFDFNQGERESISEKSTEKEDSVNKEVLKSMNSPELNSLVNTPRMELASGNSVRENLHNFELRSRLSQIADSIRLQMSLSSHHSGTL